ncbi:hypothetical protein ACOMHN_050637 [Nucella lapillus]
MALPPSLPPNVSFLAGPISSIPCYPGTPHALEGSNVLQLVEATDERKQRPPTCGGHRRKEATSSNLWRHRRKEATSSNLWRHRRKEATSSNLWRPQTEGSNVLQLVETQTEGSNVLQLVEAQTEGSNVLQLVEAQTEGSNVLQLVEAQTEGSNVLQLVEATDGRKQRPPTCGGHRRKEATSSNLWRPQTETVLTLPVTGHSLIADIHQTNGITITLKLLIANSRLKLLIGNFRLKLLIGNSRLKLLIANSRLKLLIGNFRLKLLKWEETRKPVHIKPWVLSSADCPINKLHRPLIGVQRLSAHGAE